MCSHRLCGVMQCVSYRLCVEFCFQFFLFEWLPCFFGLLDFDPFVHHRDLCHDLCGSFVCVWWEEGMGVEIKDYAKQERKAKAL